jgi:hypothetical protein
MFRRAVNKPEPPTESLRNLVQKKEGAGLRKKDEEFVPRYVDLPRAVNRGGRNLTWGVVILLIATALLALAIQLRGSSALLPIASCLVTFAILWIAARARLFRQRNGVFLAIALVALLGALIPLLQRAWEAGQARAATVLAGETDDQSRPGTGDATRSEPSSEEEAPLLTTELAVSAPDAANERVVKVLRDSRVLVEEKTYLIKTGETFPYDSAQDGNVVFRANELRLSLPEDAVEVLEPMSGAAATATAPSRQARKLPAASAQATQRAQQEAVRKYPALGEKNSPENKLFLETYRDLKASGSELLEDPQWPLVIADLLAKRENWERSE